MIRKRNIFSALLKSKPKVNEHQVRQFSFLFSSKARGNDTSTLYPVTRRCRYQRFLHQKLEKPEKSNLASSNNSAAALDPYRLVAPEMGHLEDSIRQMLSNSDSKLESIANYYFSIKGKRFRPLVVLLISKAASEHRQGPIDYKKLEPVDEMEVSFQGEHTVGILPSQRRLAEISEMIHTASLLHDDVIDNSSIRRNMPTSHTIFSNKMAILGGDYLLGRASVALARLRNSEVTELLSTVLMNLVEGEMMQMQNNFDASSDGVASQQSRRNLFPTIVAPKPVHPSFHVQHEVESFEGSQQFVNYIRKSYLKTGSLIAKSSQAATILGGFDHKLVSAAYSYGHNLGLMFQLVDDLLDFSTAKTSTESTLGKPAGADIAAGIATAPVFYASKQFPEINELINRRFSKIGDVELVLEKVFKSDGLERTRELALEYSKAAQRCLDIFKPSEARDALYSLTVSLLDRVR